MKKVKVLVSQPCSTLCDPMGCSPPGSSVWGILQVTRVEWVAIPSPFPPSSFFLSLPQSCLCTHAHTHTHTLLQLNGSHMPQVAGRCSSFKHLWKIRLKCLDLGLNWQCLCFCFLHLEGKSAYSVSFLSPSQHLLLDTICSARTWHSINACWMADFSRLPHPFLPTPTALL